MRLTKVQKYLNASGIKYNYRVLDELGWITITDKLNNFVKIDEKSKNAIRLTFQNMQQNILLTNVFKTQVEILKVLKVKDSTLTVNKSLMKNKKNLF